MIIPSASQVSSFVFSYYFFINNREFLQYKI